MLLRKRIQKNLQSGNIKAMLVGPLGVVLILVVSMLSALIILIVLSDKPMEAVNAFLLGPFRTLYNTGNLLNSATSLMLTGLGIVLAFRASVFNLGGEGQVYFGAIAATFFCLVAPQWGGFFGATSALMIASLAGAFLAGVSGVFRMKWQTNELISSYLLSAAMILVVDHIITGPLDDPASNLLATKEISRAYWLPQLLSPSSFNIGSILTLLIVAGAFVFLFRTRWGYELRMCGLNPEFARYGGIRVGAYIIVPMALSGGLHGLAGGLSVLGTYHLCIQGFSAGLGWNGIAVALIGRNHPFGVVPAALFYAYLEAGAKAATLYAGVPYEVVTVIQSVIFYLITAQGLFHFLSRMKRRVK